MANQMASYWKVVKPHIPLIKFRKGSLGGIGDLLTQTASDQMAPKAAATSTHKVVTTQILEEWQVPASYKRPPFTEEEIEYINRGGPA